jgi:hypothetical protein
LGRCERSCDGKNIARNKERCDGQDTTGNEEICGFKYVTNSSWSVTFGPENGGSIFL